MHLSKTRFFDISTSRTAFESLLQNRDLLAPEFLKEAKLATYTENESNLPPSSVTVTILLIGIVAQCTQRNEKATIIVHKESWSTLTASGPGSKEVLAGFHQRLSLIPDTVCLEFIPYGYNKSS